MRGAVRSGGGRGAATWVYSECRAGRVCWFAGAEEGERGRRGGEALPGSGRPTADLSDIQASFSAAGMKLVLLYSTLRVPATSGKLVLIFVSLVDEVDVSLASSSFIALLTRTIRSASACIRLASLRLSHKPTTLLARPPRRLAPHLVSRNMSSRRADHAGSWYSSNGAALPSVFSLRTADRRATRIAGKQLDQQLSGWLEATASPNEGDGLKETPVKGCKAIIGPCVAFTSSYVAQRG